VSNLLTIVLPNNDRNAWSKSRVWFGSASRSEQILDRMLSLCDDRPELKPDTTSFNTVLDTLAKSKERDCESRAESLLEEMQELACKDPSFDCRPDHVVSPPFISFLC
jgi:hypothetical protein